MGGFAMLADTITSIENFVSVFIFVYVLLIFAFILTSWIRLPYSPWLNRIQRFLYDVCDPYLRLFRRVLPSLGPLDLDRKSTRLNSSHGYISYAVFCLKKKKNSRRVVVCNCSLF